MPETLDDLIARYGSPYTWDTYVRFINLWRLVAETISARVLLDFALRCPHATFKQKAAAKLGEDTPLGTLDHELPGQWCFEYDWASLIATDNNR